MPGVIEVDNRLVVCPLAEALEKERTEGMGGPALTAGA
jgi:hypothetical protein